jgi:hypothetical protein
LTDEVTLIALLDDADAVKAAADAEVECREPNGKHARICEQGRYVGDTRGDKRAESLYSIGIGIGFQGF